MNQDNTIKIQELFENGNEAFTNQKYDEGIRIFEEIIKLDPENENVYIIGYTI